MNVSQVCLDNRSPLDAIGKCPCNYKSVISSVPINFYLSQWIDNLDPLQKIHVNHIVPTSLLPILIFTSYQIWHFNAYIWDANIINCIENTQNCIVQLLSYSGLLIYFCVIAAVTSHIVWCFIPLIAQYNFLYVGLCYSVKETLRISKSMFSSSSQGDNYVS